MNLVTQLFVIVAVLFGVVAFVLESFLFDQPNVQTFLLGRPEPSAGVRLWAFTRGFNLFLAAGPAAGLIALYAGNQSVGRALVIYGCAFMAACVVALHFRPPVVAQHDRPEWTAVMPSSQRSCSANGSSAGGTARTYSRGFRAVSNRKDASIYPHHHIHAIPPFFGSDDLPPSPPPRQVRLDVR